MHLSARARPKAGQNDDCPGIHVGQVQPHRRTQLEQIVGGSYWANSGEHLHVCPLCVLLRQQISLHTLVGLETFDGVAEGVGTKLSNQVKGA